MEGIKILTSLEYFGPLQNREFISKKSSLFYVLDANIPDIKLSNSISTFESCIYNSRIVKPVSNYYLM